MWSKDVQNVIFAILFCGWLGGMNVEGKAPEVGRLLTIEEVGSILGGTSPSPTFIHITILISNSPSKP